MQKVVTGLYLDVRTWYRFLKERVYLVLPNICSMPNLATNDKNIEYLIHQDMSMRSQVSDLFSFFLHLDKLIYRQLTSSIWESNQTSHKFTLENTQKENWKSALSAKFDSSFWKENHINMLLHISIIIKKNVGTFSLVLCSYCRTELIFENWII